MADMSETQIVRLESSISSIAGAINKNFEQLNSTLSKIAVELRDTRIFMEQLAQANDRDRSTRLANNLRNP